MRERKSCRVGLDKLCGTAICWRLAVNPHNICGGSVMWETAFGASKIKDKGADPQISQNLMHSALAERLN
jgi:hypothetical protein